MGHHVNECLRFRVRPSGRLTDDSMELCREPVPELRAGQALVETLYLSVDAANRAWLEQGRSYVPPVEIGEVMRGLGVGRVVDSQRVDLAPGDIVSGLLGWQKYSIADRTADEAPLSVLPEPLPAPAQTFLGALGLSGLAAYVGVELYGRPHPGETLVVTAAAGAVGSVVGQIAKDRGARVVGVAGSREKCAWLTDELGFDTAVNYRDADWAAQLDRATPDGIDVQYENVGGQVFNHCLSRLNLRSRVVLCGLSSQYNDSHAAGAPLNLWQAVAQRATIQGFIVFDHEDMYQAGTEYLTSLLKSGRLQTRETVVDGLQNMPKALNQLFDGANIGKMLVRIS